MIAKNSTSHLATLLVIATLLLASAPVVFSLSAGGEHQLPEAQPSAEALFADALRLSATGPPETVRRRLQQAMRLWEAQREPVKAAKAALQMGDRYKHLKVYPEALYDYNQVLEIAALPEAQRATAFNALALVYAELYETALAEYTFNQALGLAHHANDLPAQTVALSGLANLYYRQGDQAKALSTAERARQFNHRKDARAEATLLSLIGQSHLENGQLKEAKGAFEEALAIYKQAGDGPGQSRVLSASSALSLREGQTAIAYEQAKQALALGQEQFDLATCRAEEMDAWDLKWRAYISRARAERALGETDHARFSYQMGTGEFEGMWIGWVTRSTTPTCALGFREQVEAAYHEYVEVLMELGRFADAYDVAERAKGSTILSRVAARRRSPSAVKRAPAPAVAKLSQAEAELRLQLRDPKLAAAKRSLLQKALEDAEADRQAAQLDDDVTHSKASLAWSNAVSAEQVQKQMVQGQPALAEFLLGEQHSFVWLFSNGRFFHATLPPRQQIEQAVKDYLNLVTKAPGSLSIDREIAQVRTRGAALFTMLFGTLGDQLDPGQQLIVVADGLLHYLSFGALVRGDRYLIEDHDIIYNPSASILSLWPDAAPHGNGESADLLAIGDPVFAPAATAGSRKPRTRAAHNRAQPSSVTSGLSFTDLPRTRDEVQYIAALFPADRRKVLLGKQGTEAAFKREALSHYRRLHFATHSLIDEKTPWRSAVVLTPGDREDGLLDVSEISRLDLDCDLVVVSACQTGRGQLLSGEGIVGLSRAFLFAGARSVVVSLWNVSDISTSQLMKDFYARLAGGLSNAAALREAKLRMLNGNKPTRHPYYWSSFIMVGKP